MNIDETHRKLNQYFTEKLEAFGATAKGVDYNGEQAQQIRFPELAKTVDPSRTFSITDFGCGYGAMFGFLQKGLAVRPLWRGPHRENGDHGWREV